MAARRCSTCCISWPFEPVRGLVFEQCPSCQEPTDPIQNATELNDDEAYDLATHFMHDRHYADWDTTQPAHRLYPENEIDPRVLSIFERADDLLSSRLAERVRTAA